MVSGRYFRAVGELFRVKSRPEAGLASTNKTLELGAAVLAAQTHAASAKATGARLPAMEENAISDSRGCATGHGIVSGVRWVRALLILFAAPVLATGQAGDAAQKSSQAKRALLSGRYTEAVELYRELLRELPNEPGLHLNLGLALEKAGQPTAAIP